MHLFNKENIWSNPCSFLHTSSHPDKNNNSAYRIISKGKEREREDPRRDSSRTSKTFNPAQIQECFQCFYTQSSNYNYKFNSSHRINSTTRNSKETTTARLIPCRHLPPVAPRVSKHSTWQKQGSKRSAVILVPTVAAGFQLILPGRNSILHGSQPTRSPSSDSQAQST